jgi:hypothetical protein
MTTAEVLRNAKAELIEGGWIQNAMECGPACCSLGAIRRHARAGEIWPPLEILARVVAPERGEKKLSAAMAIQSWNDLPYQRKESILEGFDRAIALAESEEAKP